MRKETEQGHLRKRPIEILMGSFGASCSFSDKDTTMIFFQLGVESNQQVALLLKIVKALFEFQPFCILSKEGTSYKNLSFPIEL